jgi:nucleotide-binding universal stress UspA family protein
MGLLRLMIRTILYPTDLGLYSSLLLKHVMALSEQYQAEVIAVHAVEPLGVFADAVLETYMPADVIDDLRHYGLAAVMDAICQQVRNGFEDEFIDRHVDVSRIRDIRVLRGHPADVILQAAIDECADVIVMGSHGHDADPAGILGATATKVLQRSSVPVYLVPVSPPAVRNGVLH